MKITTCQLDVMRAKISPLDTSDGDHMDTAHPFIAYKPDTLGAPWLVWLPPTSPDHYEGGNEGEGAVLAPYGDSFWPTLAEAAEFLDGVLANVDTALRAIIPSLTTKETA